MCLFFGLTGSVIVHFSPLGHSVRPPHKVEVSVGEINTLLVDARPSFSIGDGVWVFLPFCSRVLGGLEYITHNPDPIFPLTLLWMSLFLGWTPEVLALRGSLDWCCRAWMGITR